MGGFDVYCALCGTLAGQPYFPDDEEISVDEEPDYYDKSIANRQTTRWMDDVVIICENPESKAQSKSVPRCLYLSFEVYADLRAEYILQAKLRLRMLDSLMRFSGLMSLCINTHEGIGTSSKRMSYDGGWNRSAFCILLNVIEIWHSGTVISSGKY